MHMPQISLDEARAYLLRLDLSYIVDAMCAPSYALPRWHRDEALHCLKLYKNFILLQKKHLPECLVPTREIDEFWHNHILYTKQYHADCAAIFGHYLHHVPANPNEDAEQLVEDYQKTKRYYFAEFGEDMI